MLKDAGFRLCGAHCEAAVSRKRAIVLGAGVRPSRTLQCPRPLTGRGQRLPGASGQRGPGVTIWLWRKHQGIFRGHLWCLSKETEQRCILGQRRHTPPTLCRAPLFCDDKIKPPAPFPAHRQPTSPWGSPHRGTWPAVTVDSLYIWDARQWKLDVRLHLSRPFVLNKVFFSMSVSSRFYVSPAGVCDGDMQEACTTRRRETQWQSAAEQEQRGVPLFKNNFEIILTDNFFFLNFYSLERMHKYVLM